MRQHLWVFTEITLTGTSLCRDGTMGIAGKVKKGYCEECGKPYDVMNRGECSGEKSEESDATPPPREDA